MGDMTLFPKSFLVGDPLERDPKLIRTLAAIDPRSDTAHLIPYRAVLKVESVEVDRRGVKVKSPAGFEVSLHPSEFEVLEWDDE